MVRHQTPGTTPQRIATACVRRHFVGIAASLALLAGTAAAWADTKVEGEVSGDDKECVTFTITRDSEMDTPVRDLHFAKGSLPENFENLEIEVTHDGEVLDGWVVDVRNGKVNVYSPDGEAPAGSVEIKLTINGGGHKWGEKAAHKTKLYTTEDGDHLTANDHTNETLTDHGKEGHLATTVAAVPPTRFGDRFLTLATDPGFIEPFASVSCVYTGSDPQTTSPTSWWRSFDLTSMGVFEDFVATEVTVPIERAAHPDNTQAVTVRLYLNPTGGEISIDELELLAATGLGVDDIALGSLSIPITAHVPAGGTLVMEVESEDGSSPADTGTALGGVCFIGGNTLPQSSPSYISSQGCGLLEPVDIVSIGFPLSLGMGVVGYEELACYADLDGDGALTLFDFLEFQNLFGTGDAQADCDGSGELDLFDFLCFQNAFAVGCPGQAINIDSVTLDTPEPGDELTIVGSGFGPTPEDNRVALGADDAGRGGVVAEILSATATELVVRVPSDAGPGSGESVLVSVGRTLVPEPFNSDIFDTMTLDTFAIDGNALRVDLLSILSDVEVESTKTGVIQIWTFEGEAAAGQTQEIVVTITNADGETTTHKRTGRYAAGTSAADIADDMAAWLDSLPGITAARSDLDGVVRIVVGLTGVEGGTLSVKVTTPSQNQVIK